MDELVHPSGRKTELVNTNKLIRYFEGCDSGKTGFTDEAGYCLSASAKKGNMRFIAVSLGAKDAKSRFANVTKLLNFAFANFENKQILQSNIPLCKLDVNHSKTKQLELFAKEDFYVLNKKGENNEFELTYNLPKSVNAPVKKGDEIGSVTISKNGNVIAEIALCSNENVEKLNFKDALSEVISNWN